MYYFLFIGGRIYKFYEDIFCLVNISGDWNNPSACYSPPKDSKYLFAGSSSVRFKVCYGC